MDYVEFTLSTQGVDSRLAPWSTNSGFTCNWSRKYVVYIVLQRSNKNADLYIDFRYTGGMGEYRKTVVCLGSEETDRGKMRTGRSLKRSADKFLLDLRSRVGWTEREGVGAPETSVPRYLLLVHDLHPKKYP